MTHIQGNFLSQLNYKIMYFRTKLLLSALQASTDDFSTVEVNPGFISFVPSKADWETLFRYGLTNKSGKLTHGGKHYQPLPDATHLGTKGLSKGFVAFATELNDRISSKGYNPSQEEIDILSTLINTINFKLNPMVEELEEVELDYTVDNTVSYGTELENEKVVEVVEEVKVKKSRKKA